MKHKTLKLSLIVLSVLLALGMVFGVQAQDQDDDEDDQFLPLLLVNGEPVEEFMDVVTNAQIFAFLAQAGDEASISMTPLDDAVIDPYLVLFTADGQVLASDDDGGADDVPLAARIEDVVLPEDGIYFVLATERFGLRFDSEDSGLASVLNDEADGAYSIMVTGITLPEDFEDLRLDLFEVSTGEQFEVDASREQPALLLLLPLEAGDTVDIVTGDAGDDLDTILYLFDPFGYRLAVNDDDDGLYAAINAYEADFTGTHLIIATVYNFQTAPDEDSDWEQNGTYELSID